MTNQGTKIRTGPLYYNIVGTVIIYQSTKINTGPLYYTIVGTVKTHDKTVSCLRDTVLALEIVDKYRIGVDKVRFVQNNNH